MNTADTTTAVESTERGDLKEQVTALHKRLHLADIRVQRLKAESFEDPPLDVSSIQIDSSPCEVLHEPPRFAVRVNQTVKLRGADEKPLAEVDIALVVDYVLDEGLPPSEDAVRTYVESNTYFAAYPYLRETLQSATMRLGLEPIVLGILSRDEPRPTEVMLVRRALVQPNEANS